MSDLWQQLLQALGGLLTFFHDSVTQPLFGDVAAWGWAIVLLTFAVRLVLLPLAVKQTRSMRAMQQLGPEVKKIQAKYKTDRGVMKTDPEKYRAQRAKQQEETMGLYRERGVNPAAGCLPLVAQMPIFFALFSVLRSPDVVPPLSDAQFYMVDNLSLTAATGAGIGAFILIALQGLTTFATQRQTMKSNPAMADNPQQKALLYVMPVMLAVFGYSFPVGVLLYWVTTNLWTMGQQYVMFRTAAPSLTGGAAVPAPAAPLALSSPSDPKGAPTPKRNAAKTAKTANAKAAKTANAKAAKTPESGGKKGRGSPNGAGNGGAPRGGGASRRAAEPRQKRT